VPSVSQVAIHGADNLKDRTAKPSVHWRVSRIREKVYRLQSSRDAAGSLS
jgi:hypothetical protein